MKLKITIIATSILMLTGCFGEKTYSDLDDWMLETKKAQSGKIKPIPPAKEFTPVDFRNPVDPFQEKQVLTIFNNDRFAPDFNRRKEPLEEYALNRLVMTGIVQNNGKIYAMILAPDQRIHYATLGNYMGQNFGEIIGLDESMIKLQERVKDSSDTWEIKTTTVYLSDNSSRK